MGALSKLGFKMAQDDNNQDDNNKNDNSDKETGKNQSPWGGNPDIDETKPRSPQNPWGAPQDDDRPLSGGKKPNNPNNPWGSPNDQQSANLDDLAKRIEDKLKAALGGGSGGGNSNGNNVHNIFAKKGPNQMDKRSLTLVGLVIGALWIGSGVYIVDAGEEAIVSRFGKWVRTAGTGPNYRLPSPIESHKIVNVQRVNTLSVGANPDNNVQDNTGLMLTADENIVNIGFQVLWRVQNSGRFVFNVAHGSQNRGSPNETISAVAEASMREVIGRSPLEKILTTGRAQVESQTKELMQRTLNSYGSGIVVTQINLRRSEPPASVVSSFREVAAASQEATTRVNQALSYRNSVVPQAQGEAARFNQLYQEYKLAPEVTRQRLYLETMEKVYERANKVVIERGNGGSSPMLVLPPDLLKPTPPAATRTNETATTGAAQ